MRDRLQLNSTYTVATVVMAIAFGGGAIAMIKIKRQLMGEPLRVAPSTSDATVWFILGGVVVLALATLVGRAVVRRIRRRRAGYCGGCGRGAVGLGERCFACGHRNSTMAPGLKGFDVLARR